VQLEGFSPGAFLHPLLMDSHSPHACSTPGICTFIVPQSIGCSTSPLRVSTTGRIRNSQSFVAGVGLSLGENHFPTNSLTWRELLIGLTTCLFNHNHLSHLERVFHTPVSTFNSHKVRIMLHKAWQQQQHSVNS
jgi:hypothetical protein